MATENNSIPVLLDNCDDLPFIDFDLGREETDKEESDDDHVIDPEAIGAGEWSMSPESGGW